jgi:hypothetical protein
MFFGAPSITKCPCIWCAGCREHQSPPFLAAGMCAGCWVINARKRLADFTLQMNGISGRSINAAGISRRQGSCFECASHDGDSEYAPDQRDRSHQSHLMAALLNGLMPPELPAAVITAYRYAADLRLGAAWRRCFVRFAHAVCNRRFFFGSVSMRTTSSHGSLAPWYCISRSIALNSSESPLRLLIRRVTR